MRTKHLMIGMLLTGASMMWGCYPGGPDYIDQYDLVYTNHDEAFNFKGKKNYAIPDKIVMVTGNLQQGQPPEFMNATYSVLILNRIKQNLNAMGYTEVTDTTQANFFVLPAAIEVTNVSYSYYYWDDYWGYYYPGGGYYYPYPVVTSYTTGTVAIALADHNGELSPDNKHSVPWLALINGLLEGGSYTTRINNSVDQAFKQSDYLHQ